MDIKENKNVYYCKHELNITESKIELIKLYFQLISERQSMETLLKQGHGYLLVEYFFVDDLITDLRNVLREKGFLIP